ncbi:MAG TPA: hypothetical protein VNB91_17010, partial [Jatrophihabitantaceae bacterium]|nr:hypothetical protein [Jatrophihabitantaceae bacterium]
MKTSPLHSGGSAAWGGGLQQRPPASTNTTHACSGRYEIAFLGSRNPAKGGWHKHRLGAGGIPGYEHA